MLDLGKHNVLGVKVDALDYEGAVAKIINAAHLKKDMIVAAQPVYGIMTAVLDEAYRYRLNAFDLVCPDGQPVRWGLNLLHHLHLNERVCGPTLMLKVCERAAKENISIFLYGSKPEVLNQLQFNLNIAYPKLKIAGAISPPFHSLTPEEEAAYFQQIQQSGAGITFICLGCPRQEIWAYEHRHQFNSPVICVGAAFDFHAGFLPRAPLWMQQTGLEWLFRLLQEPVRLWSKYLWLNPLYLILLFLQFIKLLPAQQLMECKKVMTSS